ncbi:MAG: threonine dehydratase [Candidatus Nephthysia bennettiae]|uniref:L-threonine dehydratase n=1 Tax=Candidatus Nephthysia bennettiae TaxID=3127016 RepID=A0A934K4Z8_9BACT|nr:threonine ammonia-lyase IlvA [Candidatus Dormibacteraeota bacterium]MBJ7611417.1 threonine ammonia-lyase IlvA [Candidatus Dormibacteraeota bacterium]PZR91612.1 MAG: threonine dehydratase [Candidatus Dormibacteraeota bacterium]
MGSTTAAPDLLASTEEAARRLEGIVTRTPLQSSRRLSAELGANILFKREDLQEVRSFKVRGAYNKVSSLGPAERKRRVVCASAGNHAQGVAFACSHLRIKGSVFMPSITPTQKIERVKHFGGDFVEIQLVGDSYDDASVAAREFCAQSEGVFVHPFDDPLTIAGQATIGKEIHEELHGAVDAVFVPIGGGGLAAGIASYLKERQPAVQIIGAEPSGSTSMHSSLQEGRVVTLPRIDTFVDGAAVKTVGHITFELCQRYLDRVIVVPEGKACATLIDLYQNEGIIAEPAGALSVAALQDAASEIRGRTVVCILSGGNNDILRYPEIMERSLVYQGRKHYFLVEFAQKPGQLRRFVDRALGPTDDIVRFEYMKKTNKERGAALIGIELKSRADLEPLLERMGEIQLNWRLLSSEELLYDYLI